MNLIERILQLGLLPATLESDEAVYSQYVDLQFRPKEKLYSTDWF